MSFSKDIKDEISAIKIYDDSQIISLLSGAFMFCGNLVIKGNDKISFYMMTENESVSKKISLLYKKMFSLTLELYKKSSYNFNRDKIYILQCSDNFEKSKEILQALFVLSKDDMDIISIRSDIDNFITNNENNLKSFLRGAYMMAGSLSNPEKSYHLEFVSRDEIFCRNFLSILLSFGIKAGFLQRKETYVIYVKDSDSISDLLNLIGAHNSMFRFEDIRIKKNMRNNINRMVNCETSNLKKISNAFVRQKKAIQYIIEKKTIDFLPKELRELAILRLNNEYDSLKELGEKLSYQTNKSGVNRRLIKIEKIASQIYEEEINNDKKNGNNK